MSEFAIGADHRMVTYYSGDTGGEVDVEGFAAGVAEGAATLVAQGWRVVSASVFPIRQMGTAGNVFFQSGGQFATQLAAVVVFGRA